MEVEQQILALPQSSGFCYPIPLIPGSIKVVVFFFCTFTLVD